MNRIHALALACAALLLPALASAQATTVPYRIIDWNYQPIFGGNVRQPNFPDEPNATHHDASIQLRYDPEAADPDLPFPITFFGQQYDSIWVNENGWVGFVEPGIPNNCCAMTNPGPLPNGGATDTPPGRIMVWWTEGRCESGQFATQVRGTAPTREFVLQFHCLNHNGSNSLMGSYQAQVLFRENSELVRVAYGAIDGIGELRAMMGVVNPDRTVWLDLPGARGEVCNGEHPNASTPGCRREDWLSNKMVLYFVTPEPDLTGVVDLVDPSVDGDEMTLPFSATIQNLGTEPANGAFVQFGITKEANCVRGVYAPVGQPVPLDPVPGEGSVTVERTFTHPRERPGQWRACMDILFPGDNDPNNNLATGTTTVALGSDLEGTIVHNSVSAVPGGEITLTFEIRNAGPEAAGEFHYRILLSEDQRRDDESGSSSGLLDSVVFEGRVDGLEAEARFQSMITVTVPRDYRPQQIFAILHIDSRNAIGETNEINNAPWTMNAIPVLKPDIYIRGDVTLEMEGACFYTEEATVSYEICNRGDADAYNFVQAVVLADTRVPRRTDTAIAGIPGLCPNGDDAECGEGGVCVDGVCYVACTGEVEGECGDGFVCAQDPDAAPGIMSCQSHLPPDTCVPVNLTFRMPTTVDGRLLEDREFYFGVIADYKDALNESREDDPNEDFRGINEDPLLCRQPWSDLTPLELIIPSRAAAGETIVVVREIANIGRVGANVRYRYYLSTNETIFAGGDDLVLPLVSGVDGQVTVDRLASVRGVDRIQLPPDIPAGEYYLGLLVDPDDNLTELDERNNSIVGAARIRIEKAGLRIVTDYLHDAVVDSKYVRQLVATGGTGDYEWSATGLPPGLELTTSGLLSGYPTQASDPDNPYLIRFKVTSGNATVERAIALRVLNPTVTLGLLLDPNPAYPDDPEAPRYLPYQTLAPAVAGTDYLQGQILIVGGQPAYQCEDIGAIGGVRPAGLRVESDCVVRGQAREQAVRGEPYQIRIQIRDQRNNVAEGIIRIPVVGLNDLGIQTRRLPEGQANVIYNGCIDAIGGDDSSPYTWEVDLSSLPENSGLSVVQSGSARQVCVGGTPLVCGEYSVGVVVRDGVGQSDSAVFPLYIHCDTITLTTRTLDDVHRNEVVEFRLRVAGGGSPAFRLVGGVLPPGLDLSAEGVISGTVDPEAPFGTYNFSVEMRDGAAAVGTAPLSIAVVPEPVVVPPRRSDDGGCSTGSGGAAGALPLGVALLWLVGLGRRRAADRNG